jgi:hypothetical protein
MDRVTVDRKHVWLLVATAVLGVLGAKGLQLGWFADRPPLELNGEPALLLFNYDRGCECVLVIYQRADAQIAAWPAVARQGVPIHRVNLEKRPDLGKQYGIYRAPTLLLLDADGREVRRQDQVITDELIFDLQRFETEIVTLLENTY